MCVRVRLISPSTSDRGTNTHVCLRRAAAPEPSRATAPVEITPRRRHFERATERFGRKNCVSWGAEVPSSRAHVRILADLWLDSHQPNRHFQSSCGGGEDDSRTSAAWR